MITSALEDQPLPVYGDGQNIRDWLHVDDHAAALTLVMQQGKPGEIYNIGGRSERTNLEVVEAVLGLLNKPPQLIRFVEDRLGHDRRYAIDPTKIEQELGFHPSISFEDGLQATVAWYRENIPWCKRIKTGQYRQ